MGQLWFHFRPQATSNLWPSGRHVSVLVDMLSWLPRKKWPAENEKVICVRVVVPKTKAPTSYELGKEWMAGAGEETSVHQLWRNVFEVHSSPRIVHKRRGIGKGGGAPPGIYIQRENLVNKLVSKANYGGRGASKIQTVAKVCGCPRPRPVGDISSWPCLDKLLDFDECREPTTWFGYPHICFFNTNANLW